MKKRARGYRGSSGAKARIISWPEAARLKPSPMQNRRSPVTQHRNSFRLRSRFMAARFWRAWRARLCLCRWRCPASRRACASSKRSAATRRPRWRRLLLPRRSGLRQLASILATCGGCQYQHAEYAAQLEMKQAILRETLERGGVRAPDEIAVLAGEPWAYRNRIRLAFDAEGRPDIAGGGRMRWLRLTSARLPRRCWCGLRWLPGRLFGRFAVRSLRPTEISLFCDAAEDCDAGQCDGREGGGQVPLEDILTRLLAERIPELSGVELVGRSARASHATVARGARVPCSTARPDLIIAWIMARFSR